MHSVEIIVVSNGDSIESDLLNLDLRELNNVRFIRSPDRLSMSENWSFGLKHATGVWYTVLGDDDLIASVVMGSFFQILTEYSDRNINGIKTKVSDFTWETREEDFFPGVFQIASSETTHEIVSIDRSKKITELMPHRLPTGSAGSFLRTDWAKSLGPDLMYRSISPDWYTGYLYYYHNSQFLRFNGQVVACGKHPSSSISQMKTKGEDFVKELNLRASVGNEELRQRYPAGFPTTWLARVDALLQATQRLQIDVELPWKLLVKLSYDTTPRYAWKIFLIQSRVFPEFRYSHVGWLIRYTMKSLWTKAFR